MIRRPFAVLLAVVLCVALLAGCPDRRCLRGHDEVQLIPQYMQVCSGTSCTMQLSHFLPLTVHVCDEWSEVAGRPGKGGSP